MRKNMIQSFISFCSMLIFSRMAIFWRWQKLWQNAAIESGKSGDSSIHPLRRNMLMKAIAIFYFKSQVEILLQTYQEEDFVRLEYDSLVYKITDFRLEVQVPDFGPKPPAYLPDPKLAKSKFGQLILRNGKHIAIEFVFTSSARDAIVVTDSPFNPNFWINQETDPTLELRPLHEWWPIDQLSPQNAEECRTFQRIFRYLLDVNNLRRQKYLTISKANI